MMTVLSEADRAVLLSRIRSLTPELTPVEGTLTVARMLCHIADQLAVAIGDIASERRDSLVMRTLARWFVLYAPIRVPFGKVGTVPEMLTTEPSNRADDVARIESLLSRLVGADRVAAHSVFGRLSKREWGILAARHIDHHLRQFGV